MQTPSTLFASEHFRNASAQLRFAADVALAPLGTGQLKSDTLGGLMGWATGHIAKLKGGEVVSFRPRGGSMAPKIESGQLCTVEPVDTATLVVGDIVLCKVNGNEYLHLVKAIQGQRFQIGNNRGGINGWIGPNAVFGRLLKVEP